MSIYDVIGKTQFALSYADHMIDMVFGVDGKNQVAILDDDGNDVISTAAVIKVTNSRAAKYPSHSMEDGSSVSDHRYFDPNQATVAVICDNGGFETLKNIWQNSTKLTVQSKTGTMDNMYIETIPTDEDLAQPDKIRVLINLVEQRFDEVEIKSLPARKVKKASNQSTSKRGKINKNTGNNQSTSKTQKTKQSVALSAFESVFG